MIVSFNCKAYYFLIYPLNVRQFAYFLSFGALWVSTHPWSDFAEMVLSANGPFAKKRIEKKLNEI